MKKLVQMLIKTLPLGGMLLSMGCASLNSVSLTPIPSNRSKMVKAEVSKFIFLGFNFDNDYINPLVENLKQQCPQGVVSGILTKDEIIHYFLAHTHRVVATGFCNAGGTSAKAAPARKTASDEEVVQ